METGKAIYNLLKDSADVGAICADRIYPELAQQDVDVPFIVYTVTDTTPSDTKNSTSKLDTARVELYCVSDDYEQSMNLGIAVRGALDRHTGTVSGVEVQSIDFDTSDVQFDPDQRVYVLEQTYDVRVQRTGTAVSVASFPGNTFTVEEVDGDPSGAVNKLVFSNGTVSIVGNTATVTTGGGAGAVSSVNTQTGDVVLDADDISDAATTNKFATQAQLDKVNHLTVTQAVDLDTIESDTATNNAKVSYTDSAVDARIALANTTDLADTPSSLGTAGQVLAVNTGATALEFVDQSGGGAVTSVNTQTGAVVLDADDISDAATTNKFATQAQLDKVDHLTVTQAVDLDTIESDTATNNAKVGYTDSAVDARIALADITDLADTPASLGTAGQVLAVNAGATALQFVTQSITNRTFSVTSATHFEYNGDIIKYGGGSTLAGQVYYLKSDKTWGLANPNAASTSGPVLLAIAIGTDPDSDGMLLRGMFTLTYDPGTVGDTLYLNSESSGGLTNTAPTGNNDVVRVAGYVLDNTNGQIWFNPSSDWVEVTA